MNGVLVEKNCESGFYLPNTYSWANNEGVFFVRFPHEVKQSLLIIGFSWSMFVCFFWTFHQEEHVLPEKKGRTFSFVERISLRTWRKLYFHEWVCYRLTKTLLSCSVLDGIAHYCVFLAYSSYYLLLSLSHFFLWVSLPPPFTKKELKQLFIQIKLKPTWKM